jgi:YHS domain-containing protein
MQRNSGTHRAIPISGRHSRKEEGKTMTSKIAMQDPVCGMDVETNTAAGSTEHKGQTYHFCSLTCKEKFDHNPDQYLAKAGTPPTDS